MLGALTETPVSSAGSTVTVAVPVAGADHRTRGRECALCQRLAVGDIRRADADARLIEGDPLANDDLDGQLERLIVRAYNRDGQSADMIVHIRAVRGHDGQSQNAFV